MNNRVLPFIKMDGRDFYQRVTQDCLKAINTPYAWYLLQAHWPTMDGFEGIPPKDIRPVSPILYDDPYSYLLDSQAYALVSKNSSLDSCYDLEEEAISLFHENEAHCASVNERLKKDVWQHPTFFYAVKSNLEYLLGSDFDSSFSDDDGSFHGPGTTSTHKSFLINLLDKTNRQHEVTSGCADLADYLFSGTRHNFGVNLVEGNYFATVPKSAKTLRPICIEPGYNLCVQKFLGSRIRSALKTKGVDLDKQDRLNLEAARLASVSELYATIDLKSASDLISYEVVKQLVPSYWFHWLNRARSHHTRVNEKWFDLSKFSSMGNGFTFELESAIFLAILMTLPNSRFLKMKRGVLEGDISIFGDDMICRSSDANILIERLEYFGFKVNKDKSFMSGNFFESCGGDFFRGIPVRPLYLKGLAGDFIDPIDLINLLNQVYRISFLIYGVSPKVSKFATVYKTIKNCLGRDYLLFGPDIDGVEFPPYIIDDTYKPCIVNCMKFVWSFKSPVKNRFLYAGRKDKIKQLVSDDTILAYALQNGDSRGSPIKGKFEGIVIKERFYLGL